jgi:predicted small secreted protein
MSNQIGRRITMKKTLILAAGLMLAAFVLSGCTATVSVPSDINIQVPTELPGVTINPATSPPSQPTSQPAAPATGNNPGGTNTIVVWGAGGLLGLLILIALIALLTRPSGPVVVQGPPREGEVVERTTTVERRDDLP